MDAVLEIDDEVEIADSSLDDESSFLCCPRLIMELSHDMSSRVVLLLFSCCLFVLCDGGFGVEVVGRESFFEVCWSSSVSGCWVVVLVGCCSSLVGFICWAMDVFEACVISVATESPQPGGAFTDGFCKSFRSQTIWTWSRMHL